MEWNNFIISSNFFRLDIQSDSNYVIYSRRPNCYNNGGGGGGYYGSGFVGGGYGNCYTQFRQDYRLKSRHGQWTLIILAFTTRRKLLVYSATH